MAILHQATGGLQIQELCPEGTYVAVIGKIDDRFGVEREKYGEPGVMETVDQTRFTFGMLDKENNPYRVQTMPMKISGNSKSNLFKFLTSILGKEPKMGWDYCELEGAGVIVQVAHKQSRDGQRTYANIINVRPTNDGLQDYSKQIPDRGLFDWGDDEASGSTPAAPQAPAPAPPPPAPKAEVKDPTWSPDSEEPPPF